MTRSRVSTRILTDSSRVPNRFIRVMIEIYSVNDNSQRFHKLRAGFARYRLCRPNHQISDWECGQSGRRAPIDRANEQLTATADGLLPQSACLLPPKTLGASVYQISGVKEVARLELESSRPPHCLPKPYCAPPIGPGLRLTGS